MVIRPAAFALVAALAGPAAMQTDLSRLDAASMERKLTTILVQGSLPGSRKASAVRTSFTEREVNSYLKFNAAESLPKGVVNPALNLVGERRVVGTALVDLDAVRTSKERGWLDPAAYFTGAVPVRAEGILHTGNGKGTLQVESATVGGVPIPKSLLQELVSYYSRSPESPAGFDLDKPFDLPASIREVEIQRGAATIIQ
jgi:hypothetical protein